MSLRLGHSYKELFAKSYYFAMLKAFGTKVEMLNSYCFYYHILGIYVFSYIEKELHFIKSKSIKKTLESLIKLPK